AWRPMNGTGLPPLTQLNINVILADPSNPKIVYLGTSADYGEYGGVYRTTDGGKTWSPFNTGLAAHASINMMAITPDGGVLYARDSNYATMGFFRTPSGNPAWTKLTTPIGSDANSIYSMYINSSFVYIGLYNNGMYKSGNQGDDWVQMIGSYQNTTHVIAGVSTDINLMYAAIVTPYKTIDGGENWEYLTSFNFGVNPCRSMGYVDTIAIDPANTDVILVGDDNACLVRSDDGGKTLTLVYANVGVSRVIFDPRDPNLAYLSAISRGVRHDGVMKSSDNGKTWVDYNSGLPWMGASGFELGPGAAGKPSVLYAGMTRKGIYTTAPSDLQYAIFLPAVRR
ncbi:MAG: hypothetical protein PHQ40_17590, partial [Anaerolineaceae bacterium]|nr:hypothetical protein [Anaerolineaceae bacterium]